MAEFEVDVATMRAAAKDVRSTQGDVQQKLTQLRGVTDDLVAAWKGNASVGFTGVMNRWDAEVKRLLGSLGDIADLLDKGATTHEVNEEEQSNMISKYGSALG
ncbi:MAG TPA: WXG100 family type VII secretion target [Micromonosporaceae bacterium]|nr:WXG100 family type VII secretion target [Micromonosporaceae bacterium]